MTIDDARLINELDMIKRNILGMGEVIENIDSYSNNVALLMESNIKNIGERLDIVLCKLKE